MMTLGGSLTRQAEQDFTVSDASPHIANIGHMIEDMENRMRSTLNEIYFGKTKDIVNDLRSVTSLAGEKQKKAMQMEIAAALNRRGQKS